MDILQLMKERHSVRRYLDKPIEQDKRQVVDAYIDELNARYGTHAQIFYDDPDCFKNAEVSYGSFCGCKNYVMLVGKDAETCGYVGELIALKLQALGLNTCFVALTYQKGAVKGKVQIPAGEKIQCNMAVGYGADQGVAHKNKSREQLVVVKGTEPADLDAIVEACLLAPTAINQQKFKIYCTDGKVEIRKAGLGFYLDFDLGIVKLHHDLITGKTTL